MPSESILPDVVPAKERIPEERFNARWREDGPDGNPAGADPRHDWPLCHRPHGRGKGTAGIHVSQGVRGQ